MVPGNEASGQDARPAGVYAITLAAFVREVVSHQVSTLSADEWVGYRRLQGEYPWASFTHSGDEYACGAVHTNTIEGFWSMVKGGIVGTFHKVSKKHLQLYVNHFEFGYSNRMNADTFGAAIRAS